MYGRSAGQPSPTPKEGQIGTTFSCWLECSFRTPDDADTAEEDASCNTAEVNGRAPALAAVAAAMKRQVNRNIGSWVVFNEDETLRLVPGLGSTAMREMRTGRLQSVARQRSVVAQRRTAAEAAESAQRNDVGLWS